MAWPKYNNKERTPIYDDDSILRKIQDRQPDLPKMAVKSMQKGLKAATVAPRTIVNKVTSPIREQMAIQRAVINGPTSIRLKNPAIKNKLPTLASYDRMESRIGKRGKVVLGSNGKPQWQGLSGGWLRDESTGETYAVGANRGDPMRKVNRNGEIDTNFRERKPYLASLNNSPYEITNSTLSSEETERFMQKPVNGGTRARSGPGFSIRPKNGWHPNYSKSSYTPERMPNFKSPGTTGNERKARIYKQQQDWRKQQSKNNSNLLLAKMQNTTERNKNRNSLLAKLGQQQLDMQKEDNINNRFNIKLASDQNIAKEDRLAENKPKSKLIWVPDQDPINGKPLSTGRFYDQYGTGWIDQESTDQKKDPNGEWLNTFE